MLYMLIKQTAIALIEIISLLLLVRAVFSWFPTVRGGRIMEIVYVITEPILIPLRTLFERFGIGRGIPFDLSFLATVIVLQIIASLIRLT